MVENGMIQIKRKTRWDDRLRKYKIILDEEKIGTIRLKETFEYRLTPGKHTLYLKIDWCRSNKVEFEIQENETLTFKCGARAGGTKIPFDTLWYITFGRNKYLWIKESSLSSD